jgi:haloacetate dehalogenase
MASAKFFPDFKPFDIDVSPRITIHGIKAGTGPPLLFIHGFPQTHLIWHKTAPLLTSSYMCILIDLRGYGQSSKPPSTVAENHKPYSKSVMAGDCVAVMKALGYERFGVVGHDRGARVAHKLCVDFPENVSKVLLLDIAPTLAMFGATDQAFATAYYHWFFMIQPEPFPEKLFLGNPELFAERSFGGSYAGTKGWLDDEARTEYVKLFGDEAGVHAMCEDYRAAATIDLEEAREDLKEGRKVKCDLRVLWGKNGFVARMGGNDCLGEWKAVCEGGVSGEGVESGHYIPEEAPEVVIRHVKELFV